MLSEGRPGVDNIYSLKDGMKMCAILQLSGFRAECAVAPLFRCSAT